MNYGQMFQNLRQFTPQGSPMGQNFQMPQWGGQGGLPFMGFGGGIQNAIAQVPGLQDKLQGIFSKIGYGGAPAAAAPAAPAPATPAAPPPPAWQQLYDFQMPSINQGQQSLNQGGGLQGALGGRAFRTPANPTGY